jgi:hypothetical protein
MLFIRQPAHALQVLTNYIICLCECCKNAAAAMHYLSHHGRCPAAPALPCCRLLQRELMGPARPIDRSRTRLSPFTLAALEDTGW